MPIINITVKGKVASSDTKAIVNGNSDYAVNWVLDGEWADYDTKTMRVRFFDGSVINSIFSGTSCSLPVITETCMIEIGLFAGDLITSTPAVINCIRCIRDDEGPVQDPTPSIYDQLLAKLNELGGVSPDDVAQAVADYMTDNPVKETDPTVPEWAKSPKKPKYTAEEVGALSADDLAPLTGTTAELTPSQVRDAVLAGRPVVVQYTDSEYGVLKFTNFNIAVSANLFVSNTIIRVSDSWVLYGLYGYPSTQLWSTAVTKILGSQEPLIGTKDDIKPSQVLEAVEAGRPVFVNSELVVYSALNASTLGIFSSLIYDNEIRWLAADTDTDTWREGTIEVPTKISQLTNDSGYLTLATLPKYEGATE